MKLKRIVVILTFVLMVMSLSTAAFAEGASGDNGSSKSPIEKIREISDPETADKTISEIRRIMNEGFTEDQAFKIYYLSIVPICIKTEDEIKQMFKEGKEWKDICAIAMDNPKNKPKKLLTNQEIIELYNQGYNYSDIKLAQDMYILGKSESIEKALETIGKNPPKNKQVDDMLINALKEGKDIVNRTPIKDKDADKEKIKEAKEAYSREHPLD